MFCIVLKSNISMCNKLPSAFPNIHPALSANSFLLRFSFLRQEFSCVNKKPNMSHVMIKPTKWRCAQRRLRSAWASAQSDQSLRFPHEESLDPYLPIERTAKTLIRLGGCPGWSESSLGAQSFWWFCHFVKLRQSEGIALSQVCDLHFQWNFTFVSNK